MHVVSINIGKQEAIQIGDKAVTTGIFKSPVQGKVSINTDGLPGDVIGNTKHHGGKDQAVYLYSTEDYAWWATQLNREMAFGLFGENLTLSSFGNAPLKIGDCLRINTVLLEITFPRIPCNTLGARMGDADESKALYSSTAPRCIYKGTKNGRNSSW